MAELNYQDFETYYSRGRFYAHKGNYDRAIAEFNKAIELNLNFAQATVNLGRAYHREKGDKKKAEFWYNEALRNKEFLPDKGAIVQQWLKELQEQK
jgi:tetratricopeptide (TPR) repeat protein